MADKSHTPLHAFDLSGKTILVTGASSGIGRACAVACSRAGARILAFGRHEERLNETLKLLEPIGGSDKEPITSSRSHAQFSVELTDFEAVDAIMKGLIDDGEKIDGFIHSAGISTTLPLRNFTPEKMAPYFDLNVTAGLHLTRWVARKKLLPETGSSVIYLTSVMAEVGAAAKSIYSASKGALLSASRSLAVELAAQNIRVNCISPGVVETPMSQTAVYSRDDETRRAVEALHPLGIGEPDDVAWACVYLLSDAAKWVTGTNLIVDGGYTAK